MCYCFSLCFAGADLTAHFTLNDHQAMGKITRESNWAVGFNPPPSPPFSLFPIPLPSGLLSESSHTSQRVQEHIETMRRELLH